MAIAGKGWPPVCLGDDRPLPPLEREGCGLGGDPVGVVSIRFMKTGELANHSVNQVRLLRRMERIKIHLVRIGE